MSANVAPTEPFSSQDHWRYMFEFIRAETAVGGPDPHIATLGEMIKDCTQEEKIWRAGCYAVGYNVPTAEVLWREWPWDRILMETQVFEKWLKENWAGIGLRRERIRPIGTPSKYAKCLLSYAEWMRDTDKWWWYEPDYPRAWEQLTKIWGMGRYVLLKLAEVFTRYCDGLFVQTDIRAQGAKSPREGLALLWPNEAAWLLSSVDNARTAELVEELANKTMSNLGLSINHFTMQVVLCEYKKVFLGRQYPGRTHDTELRYLREAQTYWGHESDMLTARAQVFPARALGEVQGWDGAREPLEPILPLHRYTWSDLRYDYDKTTDFAEPKVRTDIYYDAVKRSWEAVA